MRGRVLDGGEHVVAELRFAVNDLHGAATEHEAGTDEAGETDALGDSEGFFEVGGGAAGGLVEAELIEEGGEELAVFGEFDVLR